MMIPISPKLIMYGLLAVGIGGGVLYIKHVFNERDKLEIELKESNLSRDTAIASLGLYQENNERQVKIIEDSKRENDELKSKVDADERGANAGTRIVRVKASCPASSAATASSTTAKTDAVLDPIARGNYFRLKRGIIDLETNYSLCLKILDEDRRQKNAKPESGKGS